MANQKNETKNQPEAAAWVTIQVNPNDYEMLEYQFDLCKACLDAFTGIIQGLKGDDTVDENQNRDVLALEPHLEFIFKFFCQIAADKEELIETLLS